MWPNPQFPVDLVTFTEEILNGKLHFLRSVTRENVGQKNPAVQQFLCYFTNIWSAVRREMTEHKYILTLLTPK